MAEPLMFYVIVPSPFGPVIDCTDVLHGHYQSFEAALARAAAAAREDGPVQVYADGQPVVSLAGPSRG